ncbi:GTP cyclohydrolase II [Candidatus Uhrbacteria bacterium]|nr:GTP cyclohydrolase II [Candidatus Uhrbacteria bacterium]
MFTQTTLATKFGTFMIRVYEDAQGKETIVLSTQQLDITVPVFVRIHSECMTGDTFGSLQCDCGQQLETFFEKMAQSENAVLIYLRQEGRGIGLFEKIKSYQLQKKGYDTFDANVLLGHGPDERTYEKAKMALEDLGITRIHLLTNNPSKIQEMTRLGIEIVERVPLVIPANTHNERYFISKRDKFHHLFSENISVPSRT